MSYKGGRSGEQEPLAGAAAATVTPVTSASAGTVALPRRPGFGKEGKSIALLANHFNVDQNRLPVSVLRYQVDTAPPPRPPRGSQAEAPRPAVGPPRPLPKPLCRCVLRVECAHMVVPALRRL